MTIVAVIKKEFIGTIIDVRPRPVNDVKKHRFKKFLATAKRHKFLLLTVLITTLANVLIIQVISLEMFNIK